MPTLVNKGIPQAITVNKEPVDMIRLNGEVMFQDITPLPKVFFDSAGVTWLKFLIRNPFNKPCKVKMDLYLAEELIVSKEETFVGNYIVTFDNLYREGAKYTLVVSSLYRSKAISSEVVIESSTLKIEDLVLGQVKVNGHDYVYYEVTNYSNKNEMDVAVTIKGPGKDLTESIVIPKRHTHQFRFTGLHRDSKYIIDLRATTKIFGHPYSIVKENYDEINTIPH